MSEVLKNIELIEQYFEGKLSKKERTDFENKLLVDSELKEEYDLYTNIATGIKEAGEEKLRNKLIQADLELDQESNIIPMSQSARNKTSIYLFAASIVFLIGLSVIWFNWNREDLNALADKYYVHDKGLPVEMAISKSKLDEAMNKYKTSDYLGAKRELEKLILDNKNSDTVNYYLGVVNYELGDFKSAGNSFKTIMPISVFFEKTEFNLALVCLKLKEKEKAYTLIELIASKPNHLFYQQAIQISKELSSKK